jgi:hypothetical protein
MSYQSKKASALLITILMLALVSAVVLVTSRGVIISTRLSSSTGASDMAEQIAESGVQEGLAWYKANQLFNQPLEYGDSTSNYNLAPIFRGFTQATNPTSCSGISSAGPDTSNLNMNCPYYSLVVRNYVVLSNGSSNYIYYSRQLPLSQPVDLYFSSSNINFTIGSNIQDLKINCATSNGSSTGSLDLNTINTIYSLPISCESPMTVTLNSYKSGTTPTSSDPVLTISTSSLGGLRISKGYTTIESTGYAGGITSKRLVSIYPKWNPLNSAILPYIVDQTTSKTLSNSTGQ